MHGVGHLVYNDPSFRCKDARYDGEFRLNSREGFGTLTRKNGDVIRGQFVDNQPNGEVEINFASGDYYKGVVVNSVMTGRGFLKTHDDKNFEGDFVEGKLHGEGTFYAKGPDAQYQLSGDWEHGVPTLCSNKYSLEIISPAKEEEDPKAKKDPKKSPSPDDEESGTGNEIRLAIDTANPVESNRALSL